MHPLVTMVQWTTCPKRMPERTGVPSIQWSSKAQNFCDNIDYNIDNIVPPDVHSN